MSNIFVLMSMGPGLKPMLHDSNLVRVTDDSVYKKLENLYGLLPAQQDKSLHRVTITKLPGFGLTAFSFWSKKFINKEDANITFFWPVMNMTYGQFEETAPKVFPMVFKKFGTAALIPYVSADSRRGYYERVSGS